MIPLPQKIYSHCPIAGKNVVKHLHGFVDISLDVNESEVCSIEPLVVEYQGNKFCFTKNIADIPEDCPYAILPRRKVSKRDFKNERIECYKWIKHPLMIDETPSNIVDSWRGKFLYTKEDLSNGHPGLRSPQLGAVHAFLSYNQYPKDRGIIVMPTGTGKTETMLSILIAHQCEKLLVVVPYDSLREQLADKFFDLGVLPKFGIVAQDIKYPKVGIVYEGMSQSDWSRLIENSNVVIATMNLLSNSSEDVKNLISSSFTNIFVDEAHHSPASSWEDLLYRFNSAKVTLFTATPFRNDGKRIKGEFLYKFSLKSAQEQGYYKTIDFHPIREYSPKDSDRVIAEKAVEILKRDRQQGFDHILMARCDTKKRAEEVFSNYAQYTEFNPVIIHQ